MILTLYPGTGKLAEPGFGLNLSSNPAKLLIIGLPVYVCQ